MIIDGFKDMFRASAKALILTAMSFGAALAFLAVLPVGQLGATTILGMDIDQVARDAELIFEGEVVHHETREDANTGILNPSHDQEATEAN